MSISGSLVGYENNNEINQKTQSANHRSTMLNTSVSSMGKPCPSLNSSISNSVITTASSNVNVNHHHHHSQNHNNSNNTKYQNSKRKNFNKINYQIQQQQSQSHLHLNSLWSIWYGVLMTLFQGYLAIHGAYRFLGCSLIQWKIEPVAELNLQIVLCGVVFILLPLFFASAVFKVGNLANDGIKLASIPNKRCSFSPSDGLEEEAKGGTLRALWTHGGPTAAFIHIIIAMCLLLPHLLLEARVIENGLLPRENIWRTELDFISTNRDRLVVLSFMTAPYQNISNDYNDTDDFNFLDENLPSVSNTTENSYINLHLTYSNSPVFELPDISAYHPDDEYDEDEGPPNSYDDIDIDLINSSSSSTVKPLTTSSSTTSQTTTANPTTTSTTTPAPETTTPMVPIPTNRPTITNHASTPRSGKSIRGKKSYKKTHKNRHEDRRIKSEEIDHSLEIKSDRIDFSRFNEFEMSTVFESNSNKKLQRPTTTMPYRTNSKENIYGSGEQSTTRKTQFSTNPASKDSTIQFVKPEKMAEIVPSTPISTNSKIIEIKKKVKRMIDDDFQVEIEPEYLIAPSPNSSKSPISPTSTPSDIFRLAGFAGMLQKFFGVEKEIDVGVFNHPPSMEFLNLILALIVWSVRYPAVFWGTTKPFAAIFSLQMISSTFDIIFGYTGVSNLYKLQIVSEALPIQNPGLILNGIVTLSLYLLSTILLLSSSLILYLYGHGRLAARMRDRSMITMKTSETWIYFAHCASLCFVLALAVVKAPLLNDLSATYRNNLHCPTFISALVSVVQLFLWIVIWLGLTAKRRWAFKLPPVQNYAITKGATQPLLISTRGHNPSVDSGGTPNQKTSGGGGGGAISTTSSTDGVEDIYWPKLTPSSPKLKVTFNEVTSTSDDVLLISEQNDKRHPSRGTTLCIAGFTGEIDDGDYATLRSGPNNGGGGCGSNSNELLMLKRPSGGSILHLSEYDELPPPPAVLLKPPSNNGSTGDLLDDNISEEGKLLACVRDDSVTYASTRDLEPPQPPPKPLCNMRSPLAQPENMNLPPSPTESDYSHHLQHHQHDQKHLQQLVSPLAPVTVTVHTSEAHIATSSTPRCLRRADSGVPNEALTPRSDTTSTTESLTTTSPPERAPSDSSSGVHSGEEREEVVIRPRAVCKPPAKLPQPAIEEEPYGRSTNMRMSSFNNIDGMNTSGSNSNLNSKSTSVLMSNSINNNISNTNCSATLPLPRTSLPPDHRIDYSHCSTMPLPMGCHQQQQQSASYKSQIYTPVIMATSPINGSKQQLLQQQQQTHHTTLPNGVRYSNPHFLKRLPHVVKGESPYGHLGYGSGHHTFSKLLQDPLHSLAGTSIPEDRDSANYSMSSDQDCVYMNAHQIN